MKAKQADYDALAALEIPPRFKLEWPDFSRPVSKKRRRQFRAQMRPLGLSLQRAVWEAIRSACPGSSTDCIAEIKVIDRAFARFKSETPSDRWYDDARTLPEKEGGEWPPGGYTSTKMVKARGERRLYPPQMITTSGHSWDVYLQSLHARGVMVLLPDGYMGSVVNVYDLPPSVRAQYRRQGHGRKNITNI